MYDPKMSPSLTIPYKFKKYTYNKKYIGRLMKKASISALNNFSFKDWRYAYVSDSEKIIEDYEYVIHRFVDQNTLLSATWPLY